MKGFDSYFDWKNNVSLYIHVPFCVKKCDYCAFFSINCPESEVLDSYTSKIVTEINEVSALMGKKPFYSVFIGGGNPGCLGFRNLERICSAATSNGKVRELSIEMNPESLSSEFEGLFEQYVTRLSVGVQSLDEKALSFLGRNSDLRTTLKGVEKACTLREKYGFSLSFDLITCLPDWHNGIDDVRRIVPEYSPDHISVYALTLEEGTALYRKRPSLPCSDRQAEILSHIWNYLESNGYEHYEVSNFAHTGHRSLHNCVYWNYRQYIGLGPGAASTGFKGDYCFRINCQHDIYKYVKSPAFSLYEVEQLSEREQLEEFILMGMRCSDGLDLKRLKERWNKEICIIPLGYRTENNALVPDDTGFMTCDAASYSVDSSL